MKRGEKRSEMNGKISDVVATRYYTPPSKEATIARFQLIDVIHVVVHLRANEKKVWLG